MLSGRPVQAVLTAIHLTPGGLHCWRQASWVAQPVSQRHHDGSVFAPSGLSSCTASFYSGAFPANGPSFLAKLASAISYTAEHSVCDAA
jgi:hypothetical protein